LNNEKESVQRQLNEAEKNKQQDRINQLRLEQNRLFKLDKKFRQNTALKR
jgi:hypothetical protein